MALTTTQRQPRAADRTSRLRHHSTGGRLAAYEVAKSAWDSANPGADYRIRDRAMRQLARALGV